VGELVLVRHGETEWSASGRHTSYTDIDLTPDGERQARLLAPTLRGRRFVGVLCSPRKRALRTAELADVTVSEVDDDLVEWDYGRYEGITSAEIQRDRPQWNLWRDGAPGGETPVQIQHRIDRVLARTEPLLTDGDVALFGHGHSLRVVGARWIGLTASGGGLLRLDTATISTLGYEHGRHVILLWNMPVAQSTLGGRPS
jgi:broad specificity phosphatase PhoE